MKNSWSRAPLATLSAVADDAPPTPADLAPAPGDARDSSDGRRGVRRPGYDQFPWSERRPEPNRPEPRGALPDGRAPGLMGPVRPAVTG